ncbi:hypothetical protein A2W32_02445 [candidate division WWE3 bacterium RBG_16_37_10]|uniref:Uncharacterized protein n=1 Tax=candidate division WWE3 bacterium RBG_16_37_10 TaxID=1802610 RepID=A0A1F4V1L3_UNCKA|nr:MAG: hypothetical protein A2W32_02445 [candidate division WWE3 bacterium RBG_16_37_10]
MTKTTELTGSTINFTESDLSAHEKAREAIKIAIEPYKELEARGVFHDITIAMSGSSVSEFREPKDIDVIVILHDFDERRYNQVRDALSQRESDALFNLHPEFDIKQPDNAFIFPEKIDLTVFTETEFVQLLTESKESSKDRALRDLRFFLRHPDLEAALLQIPQEILIKLGYIFPEEEAIKSFPDIDERLTGEEIIILFKTLGADENSTEMQFIKSEMQDAASTLDLSDSQRREVGRNVISLICSLEQTPYQIAKKLRTRYNDYVMGTNTVKATLANRAMILDGPNITYKSEDGNDETVFKIEDRDFLS